MEKGSDAMKALHNGKDNGLTLILFFCNYSVSSLKFHLGNFSIVLLSLWHISGLLLFGLS